jgi:hypothetical protein
MFNFHLNSHHHHHLGVEKEIHEKKTRYLQLYLKQEKSLELIGWTVHFNASVRTYGNLEIQANLNLIVTILNNLL